MKITIKASTYFIFQHDLSSGVMFHHDSAGDPLDAVSFPDSEEPALFGGATGNSKGINEEDPSVAVLLQLSVYLMLGCLGLLLSFSFIVCAFRICFCQR